MDRNEDDMKFVGFFGIFKQSFKTIFSQKKIFAQITLSFILPLTIAFLAHQEISHHLFRRIERSSWLADHYDTHHPRRATALDWLYYCLFTLAYFTILTLFSLLSTAAVVFTIASLYTRRDVVFRKLTAVVPKVWKRLFLTFIYIYIAAFVYNTLAVLAFFLAQTIFGDSIFGAFVLLVILVLYVLGFLYLSVVWQLASVITVLENVYGFKSMRKGKDLVKGKKGMSMGIAFVLYGILLGIMIEYALFVEFGGDIFGLKMVWRVMIGMANGVLLLGLFLLFFVTQTMVYLVCKSHHREVIDRLSLATYLGAYSGEVVVAPKAGEEIQLGRAQPQTQNLSEQV